MFRKQLKRFVRFWNNLVHFAPPRDWKQKLEVDARNEVQENVKFAKSDPELPLSAIYDDVYSDLPRDFTIRTCDPHVNVPGTLSAAAAK